MCPRARARRARDVPRQRAVGPELARPEAPGGRGLRPPPAVPSARGGASSSASTRCSWPPRRPRSGGGRSSRSSSSSSGSRCTTRSWPRSTRAGVRGSTLTAITAWKEILLAVALARVALEALRDAAAAVPARARRLARARVRGARRRLRASSRSRRSAGTPAHKAVALGLRHDVVPVAAYFLGRSLVVARDDLRRLGWTLLGVAAAVAGDRARRRVRGVDRLVAHERRDRLLPPPPRLQLPRHRRAIEPDGRRGLPENFIYNVGGDKPFLRRLVSTFLSPLASGYLFVVALLVAARLRCDARLRSRRRRRGAGLLWTFSRSSLVALAAGLVVLAAVRRRPAGLARPSR